MELLDFLGYVENGRGSAGRPSPLEACVWITRRDEGAPASTARKREPPVHQTHLAAPTPAFATTLTFYNIQNSMPVKPGIILSLFSTVKSYAWGWRFDDIWFSRAFLVLFQLSNLFDPKWSYPPKTFSQHMLYAKSPQNLVGPRKNSLFTGRFMNFVNQAAVNI